LQPFKDKIGPGLKSSIDKIRQFSKEGEKADPDGERSAKRHAKAFAELRDRLKEVVKLSRDDFLPGLEKTVFATSAAGVETVRGGAWSAMQVSNVLKRLEA
jgi:hypothetical protein